MYKHPGIFVVLLSLLLSACATTHRGQLNDTVKTAPYNDIRLAEVKSDPETYIDTLVRWGGQVVRSEPIQTDQGVELIRLEVLQRRLDRRARPVISDSSDGRFVAYIEQPEKKMGSLKDHLITLVGRVSDTETLQINDDNTVTLPVLDSKDYYVWHRRHHDDDHHHSNLHFRLIFGSPHFWFGHGRYFHSRYYPHRHHLHAHGSFHRH